MSSLFWVYSQEIFNKKKSSRSKKHWSRMLAMRCTFTTVAGQRHPMLKSNEPIIIGCKSSWQAESANQIICQVSFGQWMPSDSECIIAVFFFHGDQQFLLLRCLFDFCCVSSLFGVGGIRAIKFPIWWGWYFALLQRWNKHDDHFPGPVTPWEASGEHAAVLVACYHQKPISDYLIDKRIYLFPPPMYVLIASSRGVIANVSASQMCCIGKSRRNFHGIKRRARQRTGDHLMLWMKWRTWTRWEQKYGRFPCGAVCGPVFFFRNWVEREARRILLFKIRSGERSLVGGEVAEHGTGNFRRCCSFVGRLFRVVMPSRCLSTFIRVSQRA